MIAGQRLAVVINSLRVGGAETQLLSILPELARRGWTILVFSLLDPGPVARDLEASGIPVISLGLRKRDPRWCCAPLLLGQALRRFAPNVVHAHLSQATLVARVARWIYRVPLLIDSIHYTEGEPAWKGVAYRLTSGLSDATSVLSDQALRHQVQVKAVRPDKLFIVPNGIDTDRFKRDQVCRTEMRAKLRLDNTFTWVAVGRFVEEKDHETLIQAVRDMRRHVSASRLLMVGGGPRSRVIRDLVASYSLEDTVSLIGPVRDVRPYLNSADAFVLSSLREGLPMALLEAMSMELPVVGTAVGAIPDVVIEGRTGYLVAPSDPDALAQAMRRVACQALGSLRGMGVSGRAAVKKSYGATAIAEVWDGVYQEGHRPTSFRTRGRLT